MEKEEMIIKHKKQIEFIIEYGINYLTEWENEFVDSLQIRLSKGNDTTFKQQKILNRIYEKITDKVG